MIKRFLIPGLFSGVLWVADVVDVQAQTRALDCKKPYDMTEWSLCREHWLVQRSAEERTTYELLSQALLPAGKQKLQTLEANWQQRLVSCGTDRLCLLALYSSHLSALRQQYRMRIDWYKGGLAR